MSASGGRVGQVGAMEFMLRAGECARGGFEHPALGGGIEIGLLQALHEAAPALARAEPAVPMQERRTAARLMAHCLRIAHELGCAERGPFDDVEQSGCIRV